MNLAALIRDVPDFPVQGILFRDITPLLADTAGLREAVVAMCEPWRDRRVDLVAAMEARGFMFGAAMAIRLDAGFVPVRKAGKLPWRTRSAEYSLEYRTDVLHIHEDAIRPGQRVLVVDDVIATGGTAAAVVDLVQQLGGEVIGLQFLIELAGLDGRSMLAGHDVRSVITYRGS
ncbi:MAG: adenine phosphoribosyltransferase [Candidatus Dormibacteraeota bacterium]|nr:adenine phosphoribosyltransferase [Candidatus Dormibacteraeota bacterium]